MSRLGVLEGRKFDVAVIGGGIIGAGVARDAALRGLDVCLLEMKDYGWGTTAGSSRLIHGGLRYLEMFDFALVRMDMRERETLLKIAPHRVRPLEFLLPFFDRGPFHRLKMRLGLSLYDLLAYDSSLPRHRRLSAGEVRAAEPLLSGAGLRGGLVYSDAQVDSPERLTLENVLDARARGACALNYARVLGCAADAGFHRLEIEDVLTGERAEARARVLVNAAGPWFDGVAGRIAGAGSKRIRTTKGVHLATPPMSRRAVVLFSQRDGRLFFVIPWLGHSWVGTTDTDYSEDPAEARATVEDVDYLIHSAKPFFPDVSHDSVHFTHAGVRALVRESGSESSVSRMHRIEDQARPGGAWIVSVLGGKITGYRAIAEEAVDRVCLRLGARAECRTALVPLPGGEDGVEAASLGAPDSAVGENLLAVYGARAAAIARRAKADPKLWERLAPGYPDVVAQVLFSVESEQCLRLSDFVFRRCFLGFTRDQGKQAVENIARWMAQALAWSPARLAREREDYDDQFRRMHDHRREPARTEEEAAPRLGI